jgi:hypothetical protein
MLPDMLLLAAVAPIALALARSLDTNGNDA